jgi:hypothetical protein
MTCLGPAFWLLRCAGINKTRCTACFPLQSLCDTTCRASSLSAVCCRTSSLILLGEQTRISSDILVCTAEHLKHLNGSNQSCSFPDFELFLPLPLQFFFLLSQESLRTSSSWTPYCKYTPHYPCCGAPELGYLNIRAHHVQHSRDLRKFAPRPAAVEYLRRCYS